MSGQLPGDRGYGSQSSAGGYGTPAGAGPAPGASGEPFSGAGAGDVYGGGHQPGLNQPGVEQPGLMQPGVAQPGLTQPGLSQPDVAQPGFHQPGQPPQGAPVYQGAPAARPQLPVLPVVLTEFHHFNRAPAHKWWKGLLALLLLAVTWLVASVVLVGVYYAIEAARDPQIFERLVTGQLDTMMTPGFYLTNNLSIAAMIPLAYLSHWACTGQRPRWLSSVVGGIRWRWLATCVGGMTVLYLVLTGVGLLVDGVPELEWKSSSLFMIASVLLTTPFQAAGEEVALRGTSNRAIASWFTSSTLGWVVAGVLTSVVFTSLHLATNIYLNIFYFTFGMVACWLVRVTGGLEAPIAFHVVNNMAASWLLPFVDISNMMDRGADAVSLAAGIQAFAAVVLAPLILWFLARRFRPVTVGPPGAPEAQGTAARDAGPQIPAAS